MAIIIIIIIVIIPLQWKYKICCGNGAAIPKLQDD